MQKRYITLFFFFITFSQLTIFSQNWLPPLLTGVDSGPFTYVNAIKEFEGDVIIGGEFSSVSGVSANFVARWNGTSWSAMGSGLPALVKCLEVYNGELYAGLDVIGSNALYKWNGTSWTSVGTINKSIYALYTDELNNVMYVGGSFTSPGMYVAKYNGSTMTGVGTLQAGSSSFPAVYTLTRYKDTLYAGGTFGAGTSKQYVAKFSPSLGWVQLHPDQPNSTVYSFTQFRDTLYVGGNFTKVGTQTGVNTRWHIGVAKYDTQDWSQLASGIVGPNTTSGEVYKVHYYNGEIYVAGTFTDIYGGGPANRIARWNGSSWNEVGTGLDNSGWSMATINDSLYVGGRFAAAGGVSMTRNIAVWYNAFTGCTNPLYAEYHPDVDISDPTACQTLITDPPTANFSNSSSTICEGQSVIYEGSFTGNPTTISWVFEGGTPAVSSDANPIVTYATAGTYDVQVTITNAGGTDTEIRTDHITVNDCAGILEAQANAVSLWPNPVSGSLHIQTGQKNYSIELTDLSGKILLKTDQLNGTAEIDLNAIGNGTYFVHVRSGHSTRVLKIHKL